MFFYIRGRVTWSNHIVDLEDEKWVRRRKIERVHHTADSGVPATATVEQEHEYLRRIEAFHVKTRGYKAIGYNYLIFPSGRCYEGRGFEKHGAHTMNHNGDVGVCFVGNFDKQKPTKAALKAERALRRRLILKGVLLGRRVPHSATFPTACCGKNLKKALRLK